MFLRFVITLVLAFALPVQGFAAASMIQCKKHSLGSDASHAEHSMMADHQHHMEPSAQSAEGNASKCSSCDACCYTSFLLGSGTALPYLQSAVLNPIASLIPQVYSPEAPAEPPRA